MKTIDRIILVAMFLTTIFFIDRWVSKDTYELGVSAETTVILNKTTGTARTMQSLLELNR